jgi:hypothetical protein
MADQQHDDQDEQELRESAESMGVQDADRKDPDELVEEARHAQTDSEASPSGWKAEREEERGQG